MAAAGSRAGLPGRASPSRAPAARAEGVAACGRNVLPKYPRARLWTSTLRRTIETGPPQPLLVSVSFIVRCTMAAASVD